MITGGKGGTRGKNKAREVAVKHRDGVQGVGVVLITSLKVVETPGKILKNFLL